MVRSRTTKSLPPKKRADPGPPASTDLNPAVLRILAKLKDGTGAPKLSTDKNFHAEDCNCTGCFQTQQKQMEAEKMKAGVFQVSGKRERTAPARLRCHALAAAPFVTSQLSCCSAKDIVEKAVANALSDSPAGQAKKVKFSSKKPDGAVLGTRGMLQEACRNKCVATCCNTLVAMRAAVLIVCCQHRVTTLRRKGCI